MRVLVAEDNPVFCHLLRSHLEKWGHEVVTAEDGVEAWDVFQRDAFPLVVSDWIMPRMDGLELVQRIRAGSDRGYTYIILLTARSEKEDLVVGMNAGADDFLSKPIDLHEFRARLRAGERMVELERRLAEKNRLLERHNARMQRELAAAARIQQALLPRRAPDVDRFRFAWVFQPSTELAGDTLNVFPLDDQHLAFYLLDVSGHGVGAALLSVTLSRFLAPGHHHYTVLRESTGPAGGDRILSPSEVAARLNEQFQIDFETGQYFTLLYAVLDCSDATLSYVSAGYPGLLYQPSGRPGQAQPTTGPPIGLLPDAEYSEARLSLTAGDRLVAFSDGLIDAASPQEEPFGWERINERLAERAGGSAGELADALRSAAVEWCGPAGVGDDLTCLVVDVVR